MNDSKNKLNIKHLINEAWTLRYNQKIEECLSIFSNIKSTLDIKIKDDFSSASSLESFINLNPFTDSFNLIDFISMLALDISLLRAQRKFKKSLNLLDTLDKLFKPSDLNSNFYYLFENGITNFLYSNYHLAMNYFLSSLNTDAQPHFLLASRMNLILCMENLGICYHKNLEQIENDISLFNDHDLINGIINQLEVLRIREKFRQGKINEILNLQPPISANKLNQAIYTKLLIKKIPYHIYYDDNPDTIANFALAKNSFFNKSYRLRTLQGNFLEEDMDHIKLNDFVDRIYWWVWNWLANPKKFNINKVTMQLANCDLTNIISKSSEDDLKKIINILNWLSLFDPVSQSTISTFIRKNHFHFSDDVNIFDFEYLIVTYLIATREKNDQIASDIKTQIYSHPLSISKDLTLLTFLEKFEKDFGSSQDSNNGNGSFPINHLMLNSENTNFLSSQGLLIDLNKFEIFNYQEKKTYYSLPMTLAFEKLTEKHSVYLDDFLLYCFGIPEYDSIIHLPKINNLINRMKDIMPNGTIKIKSGKVFISGNSSNIIIIGKCNLRHNLRNDFHWRQTIINIRDQNKQKNNSISSKFKDPDQIIKTIKGPICRYDFEQRLKISKSSALRLIDDWINRGILKRKKHGKNTVYFVKVLGDSL